MPLTKQCLFIDDDEDDRDFFCTAMMQINADIECFFAKDGHDAINQLKNDLSLLPDYIFIDMNMPLMDGKECLKIIKSMKKFDHAQVYLYSTSGSPNLIEEVLSAGAEEFLIKPSNMADLISMLRKIVN